MSVFKACDIRGVAGDDLTPAVMREIGNAMGRKLTRQPSEAGERPAGRPVVVAGDVRLSTPVLKMALIEALVASGCEVTDLGIVPTPVFYHYLRENGITAGAVVTASHNPAKYNGLKVVLGPLPVTEEDMAELEELTVMGAHPCDQKPGDEQRSGDGQPEGTGSVRRVDAIEEYEEKILGLARIPESPLHVVIDAGNGCYAKIAPVVFRRAGYRVTELFCEPDGSFPNREPNPAVAQNLTALQAKVKETGADLGVAFDGDGDRVAFVDETGAIAPIDKCIVLFARDRLSREPGRVVYDIKCSSIVPEEVVRRGGTPMVSKSGHAFIKRTLILDHAVLGGEISGHYFFKELQGDDGLYAALEMSWLVATNGRSLSRLLAGIPTYEITPDLRIPFSREDQQPVLDAVEAYHSRQGLQTGERGGQAAAGTAREVSKIDGVRVSFPGGWGLIRRSVTEPLLTFRFEGRTRDSLREVMAEFLAPIPEVASLVWTALANTGSDFVGIV